MLKASRRDGGNPWESIAVKGGFFKGLARTYIDSVQRLNSGGMVVFFRSSFPAVGIPGYSRYRSSRSPSPKPKP